MPEPRHDLTDRTVMITGGARGLGLGIARAAAQHGARVALLDISEEALTEARASLPEDVAVGTYVVDVTDRAVMAETVGRVEAELGPIHVLFNNAGVIDSVSPSRMRGEVWDWVIDVNLNGVYNGLQAVVPGMIARGEGGFIVNTSSMAGMAGTGSGFAYHASKAAVVALSESLRVELEHHGISVSVVCPGAIATDIVNNTRHLRPVDAEPHTKRVSAILDAAHQALRTQGVDSSEAGRRVIEGVLAKRLYLFTDGAWAPVIEARTAQILSDLAQAYPEGGRSATAYNLARSS